MATIQLMASYNYLAAHLFILLLYPSLLCVLCKESKFMMDHGHFPSCTVLYPGKLHQLLCYIGIIVGKWNSSKCLRIK